MVARIDPTLALHEAIRGLEGDRDAGLHARGNQDRHQRPGLERGALVARVDTDTESPTATGSKSTHAGVTASGGNLRAASGLRDKQQDGWRIGVPTLGQPTASVRVSAVDEVGRKLPISILDRPWDEIPDALTKAQGEEGGARVRKSSVPGLKACIGIFDARVKASATNRDELRSLRAAAMGFIDQIDQAVLALGEEPEVELGAVAGEHLSAVTWARSRRPMSSRATATSPASPAASV